MGTRDFGEEKRYVLGHLEQKTVGLTLRLNWSITPDLSIQYYGQPFISAGKYRAFKRITEARAQRLEGRYSLYGESELFFDASANAYAVDENGDGAADYGFSNPNFNFRQFRSNLVIRWEYRPGSALYLVWSQGRTGFGSGGDFMLREDFRSLFDVHPRNVFLIKFSYCFQL